MNTEEFITKATKTHNGKYNYSKVEYNGTHTKVCIICTEHGEFWQTPHNHLKGKGCPKCNGGVKISGEEFINKANNIHKLKYDYSKVEYINSKTKVCIICPTHGEFWQMPNNHLSGKGCPKCNNVTTNTTEFVDKSQKTHCGKYDYSKVEYVNSNTKVCIICPTHGEFWQNASYHLSGRGCPLCRNEIISKKLLLTKKEFVDKASKIHNNKYDYSKVEYINNSIKVCIICPEHGEFWQTPNSHIHGCGCPKCGEEEQIRKKTKTLETFIGSARKIHGDKYDYSKVEYKNCKEKVNIICLKHGLFQQTPDSHLQGQGCPKCGCVMSNAEDEIVNILNKFPIQQRNHTILKGKELDIYIKELKLGIEYNGLHWHSEELGKDKHYHLDKLNECNKQGIKLIQIFEDEWINHREICESKLKQICGLNENQKIFARKCILREIKDKKDVYVFLDNNHIQGRSGFTVAIGAYHQSELVGVMTFKREKEGFWELNRFATDIHYQCIGVGGKLFKYFTRHYKFQEIKSFADRRWTTVPSDNLYTKLGFKLDSFINPTYWYYNQKVDRYRRFHKFGFRKQTLHKQYGLPLTMTEREMTESLGYTRIWDCGLIKYVYKILEK